MNESGNKEPIDYTHVIGQLGEKSIFSVVVQHGASDHTYKLAKLSSTGFTVREVNGLKCSDEPLTLTDIDGETGNALFIQGELLRFNRHGNPDEVIPLGFLTSLVVERKTTLRKRS